ncbi:MAG TPA: aldo/keto reductase [Vicinamibacterales bacterium]|nr:aldo/keto reductase [Vicinamibacterales bacterium]
MISRREFLGTSLAAGASLALTPELLRGFQTSGGKMLQRTIPSSGETVPIVSFGARQTDPVTMKALLKTLLDNGGRVVDVLHGGPAGEEAARTAAAELGVQDRLFWTTVINSQLMPQPGSKPSGPPPMLDAAGIKAQVEEKLASFKVAKIDLAMASAGANPAQLAALRDLKKEGRIRYIGVHELLFPADDPTPPWPPTSRLEAIMRNDQIDFIGTDYHLGDRRLEEVVLPLAQERKIGVLAYFVFDRGRLFKRAGATPVPEWAAEFGATTWAQFFLKYVMSHPAVTMVRTGTRNPEHLVENINAGMGRLPDEATRKRMAQLVDTFPPNPSPTAPAPQGPSIAVAAEVLERYVGEYKSASGFTAIFRREGDKLFVKPGNNPEVALVNRSQTRFQDPRGPFFEFELDAKGNVTRAYLDQNSPQGVQRTVLERK